MEFRLTNLPAQVSAVEAVFEIRLTNLPAQVSAVEAVFEIAPASEGYVMCRLIAEPAEYVVWHYAYIPGQGTDVVCHWGHYTQDREEALRDLFARTGFGAVEALS